MSGRHKPPTSYGSQASKWVIAQINTSSNTSHDQRFYLSPPSPHRRSSTRRSSTQIQSRPPSFSFLSHCFPFVPLLLTVTDLRAYRLTTDRPIDSSTKRKTNERRPNKLSPGCSRPSLRRPASPGPSFFPQSRSFATHSLASTRTVPYKDTCTHACALWAVREWKGALLICLEGWLLAA